MSPESLNEFKSLRPAPHSPCGDNDLQIHFEDLQRQNGLALPVSWVTAENYITIKSLSGV